MKDFYQESASRRQMQMRIFRKFHYLIEKYYPHCNSFQEYAIYTYNLLRIKCHLNGITISDINELCQAQAILQSFFPPTILDKFPDFAEACPPEINDDDILIVHELFRQEFLRQDDSEFRQPEELTQFVIKLLNYEGGIVYNPFAGSASYGEQLKIGASYVADEIDPEVWAVTVIEKYLKGIEIPNYRCSNSFDNYGKKFKYIVSTPPFFIDNNMYSEDVLQYFDSLMDKNGTAVIVIPTHELIDLRSLDVRKGLLTHLEAVVELPEVMHSSHLKISVLLLKESKLNQSIKMVVGRECLVKQRFQRLLDVDYLLHEFHESSFYIDEKQILEEDCILSPTFYAGIRSSWENGQPFGRLVKVRDVISACPIKSLHAENYIKDQLKFLHTKGKIELREVSEYREEDYPIFYSVTSVPTIFILKFTSSLNRAAFYHASPEHSIAYLHRTCFACSIDPDKVYPDYLIYQIKKLNVDFSYSSGNFGIFMLGALYIPLPDIEEQRRLMKEIQDQENENQKRQDEGRQEISQLRESYINIIRQQRHSLVNAFNPIIMSVVKTLRKLDKGTLVDNEYMRQYLSDIKDMLSEFDANLKHNLRTLHMFGEPEILNFDEFFSNLKAINEKRTRGANYRIEYKIDKASFIESLPDNFQYTIFVNQKDFNDLVNNILNNAIKHGFTDSERNDYYFNISVSYSVKSERVIFDFINNGTRMSDNIRTVITSNEFFNINKEYGTLHYGIAYIRSFIENYKGNWSVLNDYGELEDMTVFRIELPLKIS